MFQEDVSNIQVYSSLRGLTVPAIRLRAYLRHVLNVFNNNNNNISNVTCYFCINLG